MTPTAFLASLILVLGPLGAQPVLPIGDDTLALQAQIDSLSPGGTLLLEARTYHFQGLRIPRSVIVMGRGERRTVCVRTAASPFFNVTGHSSEVSILQMTLDGGSLAASGINAYGVKTLRLQDLRVTNCGLPPSGSLASDRLGRPIDGIWAGNVDRAVVDHCLLESNARDGFLGVPVRHLFFTRNVCRGNGRMGCTSDLDPEGRTGGPLEVVYRDNEVSNCGTGGLHVESAKKWPLVDATFERNRVSGVGNRDWGYSWGLVMGENCQGTFRGNTVTRTGTKSSLKDYRDGILVTRPGGPVLIEANTVRDSGRVGISVSESSSQVILRNNQVLNSGAAGLETYMLANLLIEGCTVEDGAMMGFWCRLCPSALIQGNRFQGNSRESPGKYPGAHVEASPNIRFKGNDLGGLPQSLGLELGLNALGLLTHLEGNTFEGRRSHPHLTSFSTSN